MKQTDMCDDDEAIARARLDHERRGARRTLPIVAALSALSALGAALILAL